MVIKLTPSSSSSISTLSLAPHVGTEIGTDVEYTNLFFLTVGGACFSSVKQKTDVHIYCS